MYRYKNETDQDLVVVGKGVVVAGAEVQSRTPLDTPNLTLLEAPKSGAIKGTEKEQPNAVTDASPVAGSASNQTQEQK